MTRINRRQKMARSAAVTMAMALAVTGCSNSDSSGPGTGGSGAAGAPEAVVLWLGENAGGTVIEAFMKDWSAKNNIDVQLKSFSAKQFSQQLPLALRTGQGPDVFTPNNLTGLENSNFLLPLDDLVSEKLKTNYKTFYSAPSQFTYKGQLMAVPSSLVTMKLIYNKDLFKKAGLDPEKPPVSFAEMEADAAAITSKVKGSYGFGLPLAFNGFANFGLDPIVVNDSPDSTQRGLYNVKTHKFEFEKYGPAIKMFQGMIARKQVFPGATSLDIDSLRAAFAQGKVGMYIGQPADASILDLQLKTKQAWGASPLPVESGTPKQEIVHPGGAYAINRQTKHKDAAVKVLEALLSKELNVKLGNIGSILPASADITAADLAAPEIPQLPQFEFTPGGLQRAAANYPTDALKVQGVNAQEGVIRILETGGDPTSALAELSAKYNEALDKAVAAKKMNLDDYGYPATS